MSVKDLEQNARTAEIEALDAFKRGVGVAPTIYKAEGKVTKTDAGELTFVASEGTEDRRGDVVHPEGWVLEEFVKNPVFMLNHDLSIMPIGAVTNLRIEGNQLIHGVRFDEEDPLAVAVKGKYMRGFLKAVSVGFRPIEYGNRKDGDGLEFVKQELLEISAVPIPAHPHTLRKMMERGAINLNGMTVQMGVIGWRSAHPDGTPKADRGAAWDAGAEVGRADVNDLKVMCAWVEDGAADLKGAYKFPHHRAAAPHAVVFMGCAAGIAVLNGARGGADIPDEDRGGVYRHLARHISDDFGEEPAALAAIRPGDVSSEALRNTSAQLRAVADALERHASDSEASKRNVELSGILAALEELHAG